MHIWQPMMQQTKKEGIAHLKRSQSLYIKPPYCSKVANISKWNHYSLAGKYHRKCTNTSLWCASVSFKSKDQRFQITKTHQRCTNKGNNKKRKLVPWSTQNHKSLNEEPDFHPTMYSLISSHDGILAL